MLHGGGDDWRVLLLHDRRGALGVRAMLHIGRVVHGGSLVMRRDLGVVVGRVGVHIAARVHVVDVRLGMILLMSGILMRRRPTPCSRGAGMLLLRMVVMMRNRAHINVPSSAHGRTCNAHAGSHDSDRCHCSSSCSTTTASSSWHRLPSRQMTTIHLAGLGMVEAVALSHYSSDPECRAATRKIQDRTRQLGVAARERRRILQCDGVQCSDAIPDRRAVKQSHRTKRRLNIRRSRSAALFCCEDGQRVECCKR
jgi:hypothetical protein